MKTILAALFLIGAVYYQAVDAVKCYDCYPPPENVPDELQKLADAAEEAGADTSAYECTEANTCESSSGFCFKSETTYAAYKNYKVFRSTCEYAGLMTAGGAGGNATDATADGYQIMNNKGEWEDVTDGKCVTLAEDVKICACVTKEGEDPCNGAGMLSVSGIVTLLATVLFAVWNRQ